MNAVPKTAIPLLLASLLALGILPGRAATPPPAGVAPVLTPAGGLAIDGNLITGTPVANVGDWIICTNVASPGTAGAVLDKDGRPLDISRTFHLVDPYNSGNDTTFTGGHKWFDDPNTWQWTTSKASSKTDINNVLFHVGLDAEGHIWIAIAADRFSTSGDSYIDFEFLQNRLTKNSNGTFVSAGPHGGRTVNDLLVSLAFTSGGNIPNFFVSRWQTNGSGGYAYVDVTALLPAGRVFVALNTNSIPVPYGAFGKTNYLPNAFVEGAADLTALLSTLDPCLGLGVDTIMVKTKSSASSTATIVDFIDPIYHHLTIGPSAQAGADQFRCTEGDSTAFPLQGTATAGFAPIASTTWSVVSGTAIIDSPESLVTTAHVSSATATLRLTVVQSNACTETDDIVLTVKPLPACSITGSALVCPRLSAQFSGPAGMSAYSWSLIGNGAISGSVTQRTVSVTAGTACGQSFTLNLNVTSNGCSSACTADVLVNDTTPPIVSCPTNRVLECPADTRTNVTGVATAQDGCGGPLTIGFTDEVTNGCGGSKVIARTWTATDQCGNNASCVQTITVRDTKAPTILCPTNVVVECPGDTSPNATGLATAQEGCGGLVTILFSDTLTNGCGGTKVISRRWTATDECGNTSSCVQTITVRDTTKPTIACPANATLECPADTGTNATGVATAQDLCGSVTIRYADAVTNRCAGTKVIARTWTATDDCGNSASCVQTITVRDTTSPTIQCPADAVLECPADTRTNVTGVATALDTCGTVTIRYSDVVSTNCGGTKVIARTWTATDECGNVASCVQTITVRDITNPTITCPTDRVLECPADTRTNVTGVATAQDGCGAVTIRYSDVVTTNCGGTKVIARTWTATDLCGNSASCVQTITVRDTIRPTITCPANVVLECPADTRTNVTGLATATDGCGSVTIQYADAVSNNCAGTKVIARTWTATDECGNSSSCVQTLTVRDTLKPTISCPANVVLECPADTRTNVTGVATGQDGCGAVTILYTDSVSNNCGGTKVIARTWTAADECGNSATCVQTITVRDTTWPTIQCPADAVLECPADTRTNVTGVATGQDGCGGVAIRYSDVVTTNCGGTKVIARTWTATDDCGNSTNCVQTITVRDTVRPTLSIPADVVLECPTTNTGTNSTGVATAQDGCGAVTIRYSDVVTTNCGSTRVIARTWTATDACGNSTSDVQSITVRDTTPPNITAPTNRVLDCPANTATNATGVATATDGCGSVTITYSDSVSNSCGGAKVISRTWTATDQCGNSRSALQTITVRDIIPPSITAPTNLTLQCPANTTPSATGTATGTDGCGSVTISFSDSVSNNCGGTKVISRTWTATDQCGNSVSALQTITVRDTTPPSLTLPANRVLDCPGDTRTNVTGVPVVVDGCGSATISYSDVVSNSCALTRTIWRLWTATDQCGNTTNGLQTITVVDTTRPTLTSPNVSVQCARDVPAAYTNLAAFRAAGGTATDACSTALTFALISDSGLVGSCPGTVSRVYRVTDECGNFAESTQRITVDDTIAPVLSCPTNRIVECGTPLDPANTGRATATDNCSTNVTLNYSDAVVQGEYNLSFLVADPDSDTGPYSPTYLKFAPGNLPCPESARLTGRALDPLRNAVAYAPSGQLDALTSIGNVPMAFGQIVPFELVIQASGGPGPERGTIDVTAAWSTYTTSNNRFGYDTNYMVYCAFVDAADPGSIDPNNNARVQSYSSVVINPGTIAERIQGTFRISGLDAGDRVVVEIWVVLMDTMAEHSGGTVSADLVSAQKASVPPVPITIGNQTDSLGNLSKIFEMPPPQAQPPLGPLPPQPPVLPGVTVSVIDRTWAATDDCGNRSTCVQRITVRDTLPPALVAPPNRVLECPAGTGTNVAGVATVPEACGPVLINYSDVVSNGCAGTKVVTRTWTAIDESGFSTNVVQTITVVDTTPPVITCPANLAFECPAATANFDPASTGVATAQDACGSVAIAFTDAVTTSSGGRKLISRTWTATDECGLTASSVQRIEVVDTTPPSISCPPDRVLECPANTDPANTGRATAFDACGTATVSFTDAVTAGCGGARTILRTWTATDESGLTRTCVQRIEVRDTTPPVVTCPPNRSVPAGDPWIFVQPAATDSCGAVTLRALGAVTNATGSNSFVATQTWEATDECGNKSTCQQTVTVLDPMQGTFDFADEGWRVKAGEAIVSPICVAVGGQSGGYVMALDSTVGNDWYWLAPPKYYVNQSAYYDGLLQFSLMQTGTSYAPRTNDVLLSGSGLTLVLSLPQLPGTNWTSYSVSLNEQAGWWNTTDGRPATQAEIITVLATLTNLQIRGDYTLANGAGALDSVGLVMPSTSAGRWILEIHKPIAGGVSLRWPALATGFQLEQSDRIVSPNWSLVPGAPIVKDGMYYLSVPPSVPVRFFRLHKPTF